MTGLQPWRLFKALEYLNLLQRNMKTIAIPSRRRNLGEKTMINVIESIRRWHRRSSTVDALSRKTYHALLEAPGTYCPPDFIPVRAYAARSFYRLAHWSAGHSASRSPSGSWR